jgi:CheY-like chemotaxis protein
MKNFGPIILVDDDPDDLDLVKRILIKLNVENEVRAFSDAEQVLAYLRSTTEKPFLFICDINMPIISGLELKAIIDEDPTIKLKSIPFVILSTAANHNEIINAYNHSVQGYFLKGQTYDTLYDAMTRITQYWATCLHPNNI